MKSFLAVVSRLSALPGDSRRWRPLCPLRSAELFSSRATVSAALRQAVFWLLTPKPHDGRHRRVSAVLCYPRSAAVAAVILQVFAVAAFQLYVPHGVLELADGANVGRNAVCPISVTATYKSAGASELLNVMIEGVSLLNDGSSLVLWEASFANAKAVGVGLDVESAAQTVARVLRLCRWGGWPSDCSLGWCTLAILYLSCSFAGCHVPFVSAGVGRRGCVWGLLLSVPFCF